MPNRMCLTDNCPKKSKCRRFTQEPGAQQNYVRFKFLGTKDLFKCDGFKEVK